MVVVVLVELLLLGEDVAVKRQLQLQVKHLPLVRVGHRICSVI